MANLVGVGRGTDLLLYVLVLMFLVFVYTQSRRNSAQQRRLTLLARRIALLDALEHDTSADDDDQDLSSGGDVSDRR